MVWCVCAATTSLLVVVSFFYLSLSLAPCLLTFGAGSYMHVRAGAGGYSPPPSSLSAFCSARGRTTPFKFDISFLFSREWEMEKGKIFSIARVNGLWGGGAEEEEFFDGEIGFRVGARECSGDDVMGDGGVDFICLFPVAWLWHVCWINCLRYDGILWGVWWRNDKDSEVVQMILRTLKVCIWTRMILE